MAGSRRRGKKTVRADEQSERAIVAFDNSGTLSRVAVVETALAPEAEWATPVPAAPIEQGRVALLSIDHDHVHRCAVDRPLGALVAAGDVTVHLALSNCDVTLIEARNALVRDEETAAQTVVEHVEQAIATTDGDAIPGAQVVVDIERGTVLHVFGYTASPLAEAAAVVDWIREQGYEPHIVSGDTEPILRRVGAAVGIESVHTHPYQSPTDKRETIKALQERTGQPVVMVGDYVNDRYAFEVADFAVFIDDEGDETARRVLDGRADVTIGHLDALPEALAEIDFTD